MAGSHPRWNFRSIPRTAVSGSLQHAAALAVVEAAAHAVLAAQPEMWQIRLEEKEDREHQHFRSVVLSAPGLFPLHGDRPSAFDWHADLRSGSRAGGSTGKLSLYRPRVSTTRRVRAPPNASSPRSAISGKGLAVFGNFVSGVLCATSVSAAGGGVTA